MGNLEQAKPASGNTGSSKKIKKAQSSSASSKEDHPKSKQTADNNTNNKISALTEDEFENMGYISGDDGYTDKAIQPPAPIITQAASEEELEPIPPPIVLDPS